MMPRGWQYCTMPLRGRRSSSENWTWGGSWVRIGVSGHHALGRLVWGGTEVRIIPLFVPSKLHPYCSPPHTWLHAMGTPASQICETASTFCAQKVWNLKRSVSERSDRRREVARHTLLRDGSHSAGTSGSAGSHSPQLPPLLDFAVTVVPATPRLISLGGEYGPVPCWSGHTHTLQPCDRVIYRHRTMLVRPTCLMRPLACRSARLLAVSTMPGKP